VCEEGRRGEKGKSVEKDRQGGDGGNREGGPPLTKDGVKMEGEKCGKGKPRVLSPSLPLSLSLSLSLSLTLSLLVSYQWEYAYRKALEDFEISQVASPGPCGKFLRRFPLARQRGILVV